MKWFDAALVEGWMHLCMWPWRMCATVAPAAVQDAGNHPGEGTGKVVAEVVDPAFRHIAS